MRSHHVLTKEEFELLLEQSYLANRLQQEILDAIRILKIEYEDDPNVPLSLIQLRSIVELAQIQSDR